MHIIVNVKKIDVYYKKPPLEGGLFMLFRNSRLLR